MISGRPLRLIVAGGLLLALLYAVGTKDLVEVLWRLQAEYVVGLIAISFVLIWLSCIKWRLFIRAWGHDAPLLHLMRIYTITYFYNMFAPSLLMGDLARSYHLGKHVDNQKHAFVATFLERLTGLLAMVLLGVIFVFLGARATRGLELAILAAAALVLIATLVCFSETIYRVSIALLLHILRRLRLTRLEIKAEKFLAGISSAMMTARNNPTLFAKAMFWSILFHFGTVINTYVAARAIAWENPDFGGLCIVVPLVLLISIAPITPSGIGIQEGAFLFLLQRVGATPAEALSTALVLRAKTIFTAFIGYLLWINFRQTDPSPDPKDVVTEPLT